jgi:hypothetical protein
MSSELTKERGLSYLNDVLKLDENLPPAYVISRMMNEGILDNGAFYHMNSNNKRAMTVEYRLKPSLHDPQYHVTI